MNCPDVTSQSTTSLRAGRILDAHEKPIENLFAFIHCVSNAGRWYLEVSHFVIAVKKLGDEGSFFSERGGGQPANFHAVDLIVPRFRSEQGKEEECSRELLSLKCGFQVAYCQISSAFFMTSEMRRTRAAEMVPADPLSESIFASLDAYFRAYLHPLDNAGAAGTSVSDWRASRVVSKAHTYVKGARDLFAFLPGGCHRNL